MFWLSSCELIAKFYPAPEKVHAKNIVKQPFDAIIVPGVPHDGESWDDIMKLRVYYSLYLYNRGYAKNIIYSGSAVYTPYIEGKIMAMYGEALGIPKENIFVESRAEHSTENLYYSYLIAKKNGFNNIALATDPYQTNMVRKFRKKHKLDIALLPLIFDTMMTIAKPEPKIDPSQAYVKDFVSIMEREGLLKRFRGTRGKNVVFERDSIGD